MPDDNVYDVSQSDISINENTTVNSFNNEVKTVQGPTGDNNEIKLWKAWTMEMPMNNGYISTITGFYPKCRNPSGLVLM